jgi:hypothetical protein
MSVPSPFAHYQKPLAEIGNGVDSLELYDSAAFVRSVRQDSPDLGCPVVPDLLNAGDRLMVTGQEGHGKSTLIRQLAVQLAAGMHPTTGQRIEPLSVLVVDLEAKSYQLADDLSWLTDLAGADLDPMNLMVIAQPRGINLSHDPLYGEDPTAETLSRFLHAESHNLRRRPEVVCLSPLYKATEGDLADEATSRAVMRHLDDWSAMDMVVIVEAHCAQARNGLRPKYPYGSSMWRRWPEFGFHLDKSGKLTQWREPRRQRDWPQRFERGGSWPWEVPTVTDGAALVIKPAARKVLDALLVDDVSWLDATSLVSRTGLAKRTIQQSTKDLVRAELVRMRSIGTSAAQEWSAYRDITRNNSQ